MIVKDGKIVAETDDEKAALEATEAEVLHGVEGIARAALADAENKP